MGKKAIYGALMGLGQGISTYGGALTADSLRSRSDNRFISRQHSLKEIEQRFKIEFRQEDRLYQEGVRDDKYQREENMLTPGNPLYESREAQRKKLVDEKQANALDLRKMPYGGSSGILGNLNQSQYTQDSFRPFMAELNRLVKEEGLTPDEAYQAVSGYMNLVPKPQASSSDRASLNKSVRQEIALFMDESDAVKVERLVGLGHPREVMETLSTLQLIEEFKQTVMGVMAMPGQGGLMNAAPASNGGPPDLASDPMGWLNSPE